jgi:hypothetical protein
MRVLGVAVAVAASLLGPSTASAQEPPLPKWDAGVSFGLLWGDGWHPGTDDYGEPHAVYHFELGRFWTTHLKTDAAVILTHNQSDYDFNQFAIPGVPGAYSFTEHERKLTAFSGSATYQFFENSMMHPFVSAGVQVGVANDHSFRTAQTYTINRIPYTVPALDERTTSALVRPFVAVGAKSYFNDRTFVKSEFSTAVAGSGLSHAILRLGFGFDF